MRYIGDPLLVFTALVVLLLSQAASKAIEGEIASVNADSPALQQTIASAMTLEDRFALEAQASQDQLPVKVDEITTLAAITSEGKTLRLRYEVSEPLTGFQPDFASDIASQQCNLESLRHSILAGGTVVSEYWGPDGNLIDSFEVSSESC